MLVHLLADNLSSGAASEGEEGDSSELEHANFFEYVSHQLHDYLFSGQQQAEEEQRRTATQIGGAPCETTSVAWGNKVQSV